MTSDATHLNKLQILNDKLIRILFSRKFGASVVQDYRILGTFPVFKLFEFQLLQFVKKCVCFKCCIPSVFHDIFKSVSAIHKHNTKSNNLNLYLHSVRNNFGKRQLAFKGAVLWNTLPAEIKCIDSFPLYKLAIKSFLSY